MLRPCLIITEFVLTAAFASAQTAVRVEPAHLLGLRPPAKTTQEAAIRDYLQSWHSLEVALSTNQASRLDADFVGAAKAKLATTIQKQEALGIRTQYQVRSHDLRIVFYSLQGLSIELTDNIEYYEQIYEHGRPLPSRETHAHYLVVLTPSRARWKVRILQAAPK